MTELFTASYRAYAPGMGQAVVTSRGLPRWRPEASSWPRLWLLTPTAGEFAASDAEFEEMYAARLERYGAQRIAVALETIARDTGAARLVLLCHEADAVRCHRRQFAALWLAATGELVTEIGGER